MLTQYTHIHTNIHHDNVIANRRRLRWCAIELREQVRPIIPTVRYEWDTRGIHVYCSLQAIAQLTTGQQPSLLKHDRSYTRLIDARSSSVPGRQWALKAGRFLYQYRRLSRKRYNRPIGQHLLHRIHSIHIRPWMQHVRI